MTGASGHQQQTQIIYPAVTTCGIVHLFIFYNLLASFLFILKYKYKYISLLLLLTQSVHSEMLSAEDML